MEHIIAVNTDKHGKINKSKYIKQGKCIFPFKFKRKDVNECLKGERGNWCPTSLKQNGTYETYGYCPETEQQQESSMKYKQSQKKISSKDSSKKSIKKKSKESSVLDYPKYHPESPKLQSESPKYQPESPMYPPESPKYQPESPIYPPESPKYQPDSAPQKEYSPLYRVPSSESLNSPKENIYDKLKIYKDDPILFGWRYEKGNIVHDADDVYRSLILDTHGKPTQSWWLEDHDYSVPDKFPKGWINDDLFYHDKSPIPELEIINELSKNIVPNNWSIALNIVKSKKKKKIMPISERPKYVPKVFKDYTYFSVPLEENQLVMINHDSYLHEKYTFSNLVGLVKKMESNFIFVEPLQKFVSHSKKKELKSELDKDGLLKVDNKYVKKVKKILISDYWENQIYKFGSKCIEVNNSENIFFNGKYYLVNHLKGDDEEIILDYNTNLPIFSNPKLNPIFQSNKQGFIKRSMLSSSVLNEKRYLWYICSKSKGSDNIRTFYFTYSTDYYFRINPPFGSKIWYCGKGEKKGKNIVINPELVKENVANFDLSNILTRSKICKKTDIDKIDIVKDKEFKKTEKRKSSSSKLSKSSLKSSTKTSSGSSSVSSSGSSSKSSSSKSVKVERKEIKISASKLALLKKFKDKKK